MKFPTLSKLLKKLGFEEGIMIDHLRGHNYARNIIRKLFKRAHPYGHGADQSSTDSKSTELADEGNNYIIEFSRENNLLRLLLKDYCGSTLNYIQEEMARQNIRPLTNRTHYKSVAIGKQHIKMENESNYF